MKRVVFSTWVAAAVMIFSTSASSVIPVFDEAVLPVADRAEIIDLSVEKESPLSAWICFRAEVNKDWKAVGRYTEVFLTKGNLVPLDIYYFDVGDAAYQEVAVSVGYKVLNRWGLNVWALPYYVIAQDSQYLGPCFLVQGNWGRWRFNSLPMFYLPLEEEGVEQFSTNNVYLNYKVNDWLRVGVGLTASWANVGDEQWKWRLGPDITIKDPIKLLPAEGDFKLRLTWDQDEEVMLRLEKTFSF